MRRYLIAAIAAVLALTACETAKAADKGGRPVAMVPDPYFDMVGVEKTQNRFDGGFLGLTLGYDVTKFDASKGLPSLSDGGFLPGVEAGYGKVVSGIYVGAVASASIPDVKGTFAGGGFSITGKNEYLASVTGVLGMPMGPVMPFIEAGPAMTTAKFALSNGVTTLSDSKEQFGYKAGGGVKLALTKNMIWKIDAAYYGFDSNSYNFGSSGKFSVDNSAFVAETGLAFKF